MQLYIGDLFSVDVLSMFIVIFNNKTYIIIANANMLYM